MARELPTDRGKVPNFRDWESAETRIRWERGLAILAGMIGVVFAFFFIVSIIPLNGSAKEEALPTPRAALTVTPLPSERAAAPTAAPTAAPQPAPAATPAVVGGELRLAATSRAFPNVRRTPALDGPIALNLQQGQRVEVVGRSNDSQWLQILNPDNPRERLWVSADMLDLGGDIRTLPAAQ